MAQAIRIDQGALEPDQLRRYQDSFRAEPQRTAAMNSVTVTPVGKVALERRRVAQLDHTYSDHLPENSITSQKSSGRCWLFAALNTFRSPAIKAMNLGEDFELSQNYFCFYDKLEKANYFLENILATLDEPIGSRLLDHLLQAPIQDGGQWHMFANLVRKYGVVPKKVMPETESSSNTGQMNNIVTGKLREFAAELRRMAESGATERDLRQAKERMMAFVYSSLAIHLGEPPSEFTWQWRDKDKAFKREGKMTPKEFYDKFIGIDLDDLVCLIHDPRPGHFYRRAYTVKFLGNVVGGEPIRYLNVDLETMKRAAVQQIQAGEPVWHGCDVGKYLDRDLGIMDRDLFNYGLIYGEDNKLGKAERLMYGHSMMTHAMVFTGVNLDEDGCPDRWRVENSWSDAPGEKGFFMMADSWFDEFNYEVVVRRKYVPAEDLAGLDEPVIELEPWDPMGSLA